VPGTYVVRLTAGGKSYSQPLRIKMDPRVKTPAAAIARVHTLAVALFDAIGRDSAITSQALRLRTALAAARDRTPSLADAISAFDAKVVALAGAGGGGGRRGGGGGRAGGASSGPTFTSINGELLAMLNLIEDADVEPTTQALAAVHAVQKDFDSLLARWKLLAGPELAALNVRLKTAGQDQLSLPPAARLP
jgi:hypothetical protein